MKLESIAMLVILVLSMISTWVQFYFSFKFQDLTHQLELKRLEFDWKNNEANRELSANLKKFDSKNHEVLEKISNDFQLRKIKLDKSLVVKEHLIPQIRETFINYTFTTLREIESSNLFPIRFSDNQKKLESEVILYCPEAVEIITSFKDNNVIIPDKVREPGFNERENLILMFRTNVLPILSNRLLLEEHRSSED